MTDLGLCEYGWWSGLGENHEYGQCPNQATHIEYWFDEEGVEVEVCDEHDRDNR